MRDLKLLFFERKTHSAFRYYVPVPACVSEMPSITSVLASKGSANPSKLGSMVDVKRS